jgi:hypothetical protein
MNINAVTKSRPSEELFFPSAENGFSPKSSQDQLLKDELDFARKPESSNFSSLDLKSQEVSLVNLVERAEQIQKALLEMALLEQKELGDIILKKQEEFGKYLAEKRKTAKSISDIHFLEKIASGIFSLFSVAIGAALISTMAPPAIYAGSLFASSGIITLAGLGLEGLGFDPSITKPIQMAGLTIGLISSLISGYINPELLTNHLFRAGQASLAIFTGVTTIASSLNEAKLEDIESHIAEKNKDKDLNKQQLEKIAQELSEMMHLGEVAKQAHEILKKEHELKLQYLSNQQQMG